MKGRHGDHMRPHLLQPPEDQSQPGLCRPNRRRQTGQTDDRIWLVSFMDYDLGYFDDETCRLEPIQNPFGPKVLGPLENSAPPELRRLGASEAARTRASVAP